MLYEKGDFQPYISSVRRAAVSYSLCTPHVLLNVWHIVAAWYIYVLNKHLPNIYPCLLPGIVVSCGPYKNQPSDHIYNNLFKRSSFPLKVGFPKIFYDIAEKIHWGTSNFLIVLTFKHGGWKRIVNCKNIF